MKKSGFFKIVYDFTNDKDVSCLVVVEKKLRGYSIINTFYGKAAEDLYNTLIGEGEVNKEVNHEN